MILSSKNSDEAKKIFQKIIDIGIQFKNQEEFRKKVLSVDAGLERLDYHFPRTGKNMNEILNEIESSILPYCSNFGSTNFMGFEDAGNSIAGIGGSILSDFLQQNLINQDFAAPFGTFFDIQTVIRLRTLLGYTTNRIGSLEDVGGLVVTGGTLSNAVGLLLARERAYSAMNDGLYGSIKKYTIVPKGLGHYSIESSLMFLGCGKSIIEVETKDYRYDLEELRKVLIQYKGQIMALVAYAGDSRTLTVDNFKGIYDLAKSIDPDIRLHADACHGSILAFSEQTRPKIAGIELFDSITTDPHKALATPYMLSVVLFKDPEKIKSIATSSSLILNYPFAFGMFTPFLGSKNRMSLKFWMLIKNFGKEGLELFVKRRMEVANYLYEQIKKRSYIIPINKPDINGVAFLVKPTIGEQDIDVINTHSQKIYKYLIDEGKYLLHQFSIPMDVEGFEKGKLVFPLRYMSGNDNITHNDIDGLISHILLVSGEIHDGKS